jgi:RHS repeat-associated protein
VTSFNAIFFSIETCDDLDGSIDPTSEIIEESNYYPFGLKQKGYNTDILGGNALAQQWKFGGKEYNEELGLNWYDVTARNYDPALGRWMNIDPLAEKMRRHSPYNFAFDNPIYFQDYDGMMPQGPGDPPGLLGKLFKVAKSAWNATSLSEVNIGLGIGAKVNSVGGKATISEASYSFEKNQFSYKAMKVKVKIGNKASNIGGEINVAHTTKDFDDDSASGGFIKLEGEITDDFETKKGSVELFARDEDGDEGGFLINSEEKSRDVTLKESKNITDVGLKLGVGLKFKFDMDKFEEGLNESEVPK